MQFFKINAFLDFRGHTAALFDNSIADSLDFHLCQINQGYSLKAGTLRGLLFQTMPYVQVLHGSIYNVAVDIRPESSTFGTYYAEILSFENQKIAYIPRGFAHGYLTLEDNTLMQWCVDNDFCSEAARCLRYNDLDIHSENGERGIRWPWDFAMLILSDKDRSGQSLKSLR